MSSVKIEPFFFGNEEDGLHINTEQLPGAIEKSSEETKETPLTTEKENSSKSVVIPTTGEVDVIDEDNQEEPDGNDSFNFFSDSTAKKDKVKEEKVEKLSSDSVDYKGFADFLIETEVWKDFEGREDIEYNEDVFKTLWKAQTENKAKEYLEEERSQFGNTANQLIDYLKNNGNIEDFVSNYSQQTDYSSIDLSEESGQEKAIKEYYKTIDWSETKIKKHIERLKDSGDVDFKEEAEDCKTKLVEAVESQRDEMLKEQEAIAEDRKIKSQKFNASVRDAIYKNTNLADREKKDLDKFVFEYKYQDNNGNKYSEFAVKMNEINQDAKKYAKFLSFVKNIDSFEDKETVKKEEAKKTFNFLKKGSNPLEGAQSAEVTKTKPNNTPPGFKFK